jgi:hypothetical protein
MDFKKRSKEVVEDTSSGRHTIASDNPDWGDMYARVPAAARLSPTGQPSS